VRLTRRPRLPEDARTGLALERGERVLAASRRIDGGWLAATERALLAAGLRVDWTSCAHAEWDAEAGVLEVVEVAVQGGQPARHRFVLDEPGFLPETVHERVMASIVASRHVAVQGRRGVRAVARQAPGADGLQWQVIIDQGIDAHNPQVRAVARDTLNQLQREFDV
jgi:hypothetical protein